jgi:hypothetical protein
MSRKRKIWVVVSLVAALVLLIPLELRWRAQWRLNAYRKKLIAAGEKLTVEELAPKINWQATNTALFLKLATALPSFSDYSPSAMRSIKPGAARAVWRQTRCLQKMDEGVPAIDVWPVLMEAVGTNQAALGQLRALLDAGGIEFIQDYSQPDLNPLDSHAAVAEKVVVALKASAMWALHQGRKEEAFEYLKSSGTLCQIIAKTPLMIDQLVLYPCVSMMVSDIWEALQAGGWTDDQLAEWQHQWEGLRILAMAESSLAMERARAPMEFEQARASSQEINSDIWDDFLLNSRKGISEFITAYPRYWGWRWIWHYQDERRYLELMQGAVEATRDAQKRRSVLAFVKEPSGSTDFNPAITNYFDVAGMMTAINKKFVSLALRAQTEVNIVTAAIALEQFRLAHHAYPAALADLAPEFMQAAPVDCMDGHDLRYRLKPDGTYLLYSVGEDGVDNGGDPTPEKEKRPGLLNGRDWVWPRPATDEEVQAYEAEQNKPKAGTKRP